MIGLALAAAPWLGAWVVLAAVVIHNVLRVAVTTWGLDLGLREGLGVGRALDRSWLPRGAERAQRAAGFFVGLAVPVVAWRLLAGSADGLIAATVGAAAVAVGVDAWRPRRGRMRRRCGWGSACSVWR